MKTIYVVILRVELMNKQLTYKYSQDANHNVILNGSMRLDYAYKLYVGL